MRRKKPTVLDIKPECIKVQFQSGFDGEERVGRGNINFGDREIVDFLHSQGVLNERCFTKECQTVDKSRSAIYQWKKLLFLDSYWF